MTLNPSVRTRTACRSPNVHYDDYPNDIAMRNDAYEAGRGDLRGGRGDADAADAALPSTHNLGTNRMNESPRDGVVNGWGQSHDIANLSSRMEPVHHGPRRTRR